MSLPEPAFAAPWHAEAFALVIALQAQGAFTWPEWTEALSAELRARGQTTQLDGGDDYFEAWIATLAQVCQTKDLVSLQGLEAMTTRWREAYLATPHGRPVNI